MRPAKNIQQKEEQKSILRSFFLSIQKKKKENSFFGHASRRLNAEKTSIFFFED
jgi:hypothetical protein